MEVPLCRNRCRRQKRYIRSSRDDAGSKCAQNYNASAGQYGQYRCNRLRFVSGGSRRRQDPLYLPLAAAYRRYRLVGSQQNPAQRGGTDDQQCRCADAAHFARCVFKPCRAGLCVPLRCNRCRRQQRHLQFRGVFRKDGGTADHHAADACGGSADGYCRVPRQCCRRQTSLPVSVGGFRRYDGLDLDRYTSGHLNVL